MDELICFDKLLLDDGFVDNAGDGSVSCKSELPQLLWHVDYFWMQVWPIEYTLSPSKVFAIVDNADDGSRCSKCKLQVRVPFFS